MLQELAVASATDLIHYNPDKRLKKIAVAESAERLFRRAKDVTQLKTAIETKLVAQGEYVCWRYTVVQHGGDHKSESRLPNSKLDLPKDDPGHLVAHRWRKAVCRKDASGTVIDASKLAQAVQTALNRCRRVVEQERGFGAQGSGEDKFYTPSSVMALVRKVFGSNPDLDPASDEMGNRSVKAKSFFLRTMIVLGENGMVRCLATSRITMAYMASSWPN
jgi:hypothetical protein